MWNPHCCGYRLCVTEHGGVGEEVCYRSDLPLWATPLTPWAPVATPNPLGRRAGAAGAKHHITCLFRQPAWKISSPHSTSFPRQFHSHGIVSWSCLAGHVSGLMREMSGCDPVGKGTRWEREQGRKGAKLCLRRKATLQQTPLRASQLPGNIFVKKVQYFCTRTNSRCKYIYTHPCVPSWDVQKSPDKSLCTVTLPPSQPQHPVLNIIF